MVKAGKAGTEIAREIDAITDAAKRPGIVFEKAWSTFRAQLTLAEFDEMYPLDLGWPHFVADEEREAVQAAEEARRMAQVAEATSLTRDA